MRLLDKDFIEINVEQSSRGELLKYMGSKLMEKNIVKESYPQAVAEREKEFPTGILCRNISIAIPHTTGKHVNEPKISVTVLKNPVEFCMMGEPEQKVDASVIIMIAINNPDLQIDFLQRLVTLIENHELLINVKNAASIDEVYELLSFLNEIK